MHVEDLRSTEAETDNREAEHRLTCERLNPLQSDREKGILEAADQELRRFNPAPSSSGRTDRWGNRKWIS